MGWIAQTTIRRTALSEHERGSNLRNLLFNTERNSIIETSTHAFAFLAFSLPFAAALNFPHKLAAVDKKPSSINKIYDRGSANAQKVTGRLAVSGEAA
jgi:hypothetical protein